jgi:ribonuclease HII
MKHNGSGHGLLLQYEKTLLDKGHRYIAGVDEVGRGALAGPLVVGAVVLDPKHLSELSGLLDFRNNDVTDPDYPENLLPYTRIKDSKLLTPKIRKILSDFIKKHSVCYSIEVIENTKIDEWGISKSTQIAFFNALSKLSVKPHHILTDLFTVNAVNADLQTNIKNGDKLSVTIAAASIIAKVYRDELMSVLHEKSDYYKQYEFHSHKGYGTRKHLEAISKYGICDLHRRSFSPISGLTS